MPSPHESSRRIVYDCIGSTYQELLNFMTDDDVRRFMTRMLDTANKLLEDARLAYFNEQKAEATYAGICRTTRETFETAQIGSDKFFEFAGYLEKAYSDYNKTTERRIAASELYQFNVARVVAIAQVLDDLETRRVHPMLYTE